MDKCSFSPSIVPSGSIVFKMSPFRSVPQTQQGYDSGSDIDSTEGNNPLDSPPRDDDDATGLIGIGGTIDDITSVKSGEFDLFFWRKDSPTVLPSDPIDLRTLSTLAKYCFARDSSLNLIPRICGPSFHCKNLRLTWHSKPTKSADSSATVSSAQSLETKRVS